jgi:dTDP-4-dehydrorhamnose 3,5-epimerase
MKIETTHIHGVYLLSPEPFIDARGSFSRIFCREELATISPGITIEQINHSVTVRKGCVRGLHFQHAPHAEKKIVKCIRGRVFDVAVDLRKNSRTLMQWYGTVLSAENMQALVIPEGCAHGFQALDDNVELIYMSTAAYCSEAEGTLHHKDPAIGIAWPEDVTLVSPKDNAQIFLPTNFVGIEV